MNIDKTEAIKRLDALDKESKILRDIINKKEELIDRIKTYSDVCRELGIEELTESDFKFLPKEDRKKQLAFHKIKNIEKLFNEGWNPNWDDQNEYKYYPYFKKEGFGFVLFDSYSDFLFFCGFPGFYYKTKQISDYVGNTFVKVYQDLID